MRTRLLMPHWRSRRARAGSAVAAMALTTALLFASGATEARAHRTASSRAADRARTVLSVEQSRTSSTIRQRPPCQVPNVIGETFQQARELLTALHCEWRANRRSGRVHAQRPRPGRMLPHGAKIGLYLVPVVATTPPLTTPTTTTTTTPTPTPGLITPTTVNWNDCGPDLDGDGDQNAGLASDDGDGCW